MIRLNVQLTQDDVEILLDSLGVEVDFESNEKKQLRRKLEALLQLIRENKIPDNYA